MTMLPLPLKIENAPPSRPASGFLPTLKWPSLDNSYSSVDLGRFPSQDEEIFRYSAGEFGAWSENFMSSIRRARLLVWLIDGFLLKSDERATSSFARVFDRAFCQTSAQDIRLLTSSKDGYQEQIEFLGELQNMRRAPPRNEAFTIEVRFLRGGRSSARLPHDRFALIDDELWHWGANVGGTHHEINAYSHGWLASDTGAVGYFERLWNAAEVPS